MPIPGIFKTTVFHLPLVASTTSDQAIELINTFYRLNLDSANYKPSQAFVGDRGLLAIELIGAESGEVEATFMDLYCSEPAATLQQTTKGEETEAFSWELGNPLYTPQNYESWLAEPVQLISEVEFEFLDELANGQSAPTDTPTNLPYILAQLLNVYNCLPMWQSGTLSTHTTGGFKRVYKGESKNAPAQFQIDYSPHVAIIEITHGNTLGYLCLRT